MIQLLLLVLLIGVALATVLAALGSADLLPPRMALLLAIGLLVVGLASVALVLQVPEVERAGHGLGYFLLAIPLAFAFFAYCCTRLQYASKKPMQLLLTVPAAFSVGTLVAVNLAVALGLVEPL